MTSQKPTSTASTLAQRDGSHLSPCFFLALCLGVLGLLGRKPDGDLCTMKTTATLPISASSGPLA